MVSPKKVFWTLAAIGIFSQKWTKVKVKMPRFQPETSCIELTTANHYYTMPASLKNSVKYWNKFYIWYFFLHFMAKIPIAARVQTTFFGLTTYNLKWCPELVKVDCKNFYVKWPSGPCEVCSYKKWTMRNTMLLFG